MKKDVEEKCSTFTTCMNCGKNLVYQLPMTKKLSLPLLTVLGREKQKDVTGILDNKHVTGQPYILIGIDRYSKWPVLWICELTEAQELINFLENSINLYGVPEKPKSDIRKAFTSKVYREF